MLLANTQQIREADRIQIEQHQFPGILLMENAGRKVAEKLLELFPDQQTFLVLAGPGNNGGDGLVIARYLHLWGKSVRVLLSHPGDKYKGDAQTNYDILRHLPVEIREFGKSELNVLTDSAGQPPLVIDALLGTGIKAELREPIISIIGFFSNKNLITVAIDLPSGLNSDTGEQINTVIPASYTFTFQLPKICHYVSPASNACGEVITLDIGIWPQVVGRLGIQRTLITHEFVQKHYRSRKNDSHKGTFGHVLVIAGSRDFSGAVGMASYAALKAGAGLVTAACPDSCRLAVYSRFPEVMCVGVGEKDASHFGPQDVSSVLALLEGKQVVVLGPGLGQHPETHTFFEEIIPQIKLPLVLDADGLNLLSAMPELWNKLPEKTILTPHPGEMQRLTKSNACKTQRLESAESLAAEKGKIVVLKGAGTIIALPDGTSYVNTSGNPGMATGGSGDILTGIIGGLLGQNYPPEIAAPMGVFLHGDAGDRAADEFGPEALTATMIADHITFSFHKI